MKITITIEIDDEYVVYKIRGEKGYNSEQVVVSSISAMAQVVDGLTSALAGEIPTGVTIQ